MAAFSRLIGELYPRTALGSVAGVIVPRRSGARAWYIKLCMAGGDVEEFADDGFGESSRYAAHLDRGWALLDRGDLEAARTSVNHAQEVRPDDPDALVLQGAIALAEGSADEALRCYERAIELDPEYLEPYAAAAQVCLFDLDDPPRALRLLDDALELDHLTPFELLDLQLTAVECELALRQDAAARRRLHACAEIGILDAAVALPSDPEIVRKAADDPNPERAVAAEYLVLDDEGDLLEEEERLDRLARVFQLAMRLGRLRLDLAESDEGLDLLRRLVERFPDEGDAWYLAGEAESRHGGDTRRGSEASLRCLQLDARLDLPSWLPSGGIIHGTVLETLQGSVDAQIRALVGTTAPGISLLILDQPSPELVAEGVDPRIPALALGIRPEGSQDEVVMTGLSVYVRSISRYCRDAEQFEAELRFAVLDELAVFLQIGDERRDALGLPPAPPPPAAEPEPEEPKPKARRKRRRR